MKQENEKKRHHFIPVAYLNAFTGSNGRLFVYKKDSPGKPHAMLPRAIAFENYYYSQPLPDGGQDNNILEDLFGTVETDWPGVLAAISSTLDLTKSQISQLYQFMGLLRVRVPAARDPIELILANVVRQEARSLLKQGRIPPPPANISNLYEDMEIAIDPHQSILAMVPMMQGFARLLDGIGLEVVRNTTGIPFATSDNPVIYFDPSSGEEAMLPYAVKPGGEVELLFPLTPGVLIRGGTKIPIPSFGTKLGRTDMALPSDVKRVNRMVAKFGYRFVFAMQDGLETLVAKHAATSPTVDISKVNLGDNGELPFTEFVFASRPSKPKWKNRH